MTHGAHFSHSALVFCGMNLPEEGTVVGYAAIIHRLQLEIPVPGNIALISAHNRRYVSAPWVVFPNVYLPDDNRDISEMEALYRHLVFALKYEGVNLLAFKKLAQHYDQDQLALLTNFEPTGQYARRTWFLLEWLLDKPLPGKEDIAKKSYVKVLDEKLQYGTSGVKSPRHLVINNLPGNKDFCPLIFKTPKLAKRINEALANQNGQYLQGIRKDILQRAAAFLLLKDSKASFSIEGESPKSKRAGRWGHAIGQAGMRTLSKEELCRLQQIVIENPRFLNLGYRQKGGFVGEHDRITGEPIPDHISAKWQDLEVLMQGLISAEKKLAEDDIDPVLAAATIAFGFVFIHPFEDGNGRIHRYLIHHVLAQKLFSQEGIVFPVSASILDRIGEYRKALEAFSLPLLEFIQWEETIDHNLEVINDTIDFYRYFDATPQAEFLYDCVQDTVQRIIPDELDYLARYDAFKRFLTDEFDMPDKTVAMLVRFLEQNRGKFSKRAREKEFSQLTETETERIEERYHIIWPQTNA